MAWQGTVDKLAICKMYTRKNAQVVTDLQTSCNKVVVQIDIRMYSHCKSGYHLVTRLMTVTDLQQVVPTRPLQAVRNKLLYEQSLLSSTCYVQTISDLLEQLVVSLLASSTLLQEDNNSFQTCQQLGASRQTHPEQRQAMRFLSVYMEFSNIFS
jgi:hypothetical protein